MVAAIKEGIWVAGEKIPSEMELAELFQVGRNSIREATKALAIFGIVESKPGQGTFVSPDALRKISNNELMNYISDDSSWKELMQVRLLLEVQAAYWAAENATDEDIQKLYTIMDLSTDGGTNVRPRDLDHLKYHSDFHEAIAEIGGNSLVLKLLRSIRNEIDTQRHKYLDITEEDWNRMMEEHRQIVEYIRNHEPQKASQAMREHLLKGLYNVIRNEEEEDKE
jgi:GntR family transcriptional repressor for pyruvate dehydrogenase complex